MVCAPFRCKTFTHLLANCIIMHIFHKHAGLLNVLTEEVRDTATQCLLRDRSEWGANGKWKCPNHRKIAGSRFAQCVFHIDQSQLLNLFSLLLQWNQVRRELSLLSVAPVMSNINSLKLVVFKATFLLLLLYRTQFLSTPQESEVIKSTFPLPFAGMASD